MKRAFPVLLTLAMLLALASSHLTTFAQTDQSIDIEVSEPDDAAPVARVARLSFMEGEVSFLRAGVTEWAPAVENLPLLAGDHVYAARGARAEVQIGRGSYVRLSENTELTIAELSEAAAQFEVTEGTAIIRLERVASAFGRFEVDTPNSAIVFEKDGLYRIEVRGAKQSELIVRSGGADVSTEEGSFRVGEGRRLLVDTSTGGRLELADDRSPDDWDRWSYERDSTIARTSIDLAPEDVTKYETTYNGFYGVSDLSSYGTWTSYSSYGQCWIPRVSADWVPYRLGQWIWIPSAGWTWLSSEPWGWAPYHYGRWAYLSGLGWAWIPGFGLYNSSYGYRDYRWRPALVYFFNCSTPTRNYVGWRPLGPGQRWRRPDRGGRDDGHAHLRYPSPRDVRRRPDDNRYVIQPIRAGQGVTILPVEGFTRGDRAGRPTAPGRELSGWIEKGARPGLPEIKPAPVAAAPAVGEGDPRGARRIAVPPSEMITRPVVTRNLDAGGATRLGAVRERRLISPPHRGDSARAPAMIEQDSNRGSRGNSKRGSDSPDASPRIRLPLQTSPSTDGSSRGEQRNRENASNSQLGARPREGSDRHSGSRESEVSTPQQEPRSREQIRQERRQERERRQEQPRSENRDQARQERRQEREQRQEQPRSENRDQARQERHQEREQRQERQQQQEQRRKP